MVTNDWLNEKRALQKMKCSFSLVLLAFGDSLDTPVAYALNDLNKDDKNQYHCPHDFWHVAVVTVSNADVTQATATDGTSHG